MKHIAIFIIALAVPIACCSQSVGEFGRRLTIGSSLTYIWESNPDIRNTYHVTTWEKNIAVSLTRSLYFGLSHKNIFARGSSIIEDNNDRERHNMFGAFVQYDFLPAETSRLIAEVSYHVGDYCTCGDADPYWAAGLRYLGLGLGYDLPLRHGLSLDLGFTSHYILNEVLPFKYSSNLYIIGLNYTIERAKP